MKYRAVLTALAAILVAQGAHAEDTLIFSREGDVYHGNVLDSTADSITVDFDIDGTRSTHTVAAERFDPHFFYRVRDEALGDDVAGRIVLAKWAVDNGLFSRAKVQMDRCRSIDPEAVEEFMKTEFPKIKEGIAASLMEGAHKAFRAGSMTNAQKYASAVLTKLQGTSQDDAAKALLAKIRAKVAEQEESRRAQRRRSEATDEAIEANKEVAMRDATLGPVENEIDGAEASNQSGLTGKNLSEQKSGFETAAARYKRAIQLCDDFSKKTEDAALLKALAEMSVTATEGAVQAYLNLANTYSSRGNYVKGTEYCNMALAVDPNNAEAKAARAAISTTNGGWDRRRGRR